MPGFTIPQPAQPDYTVHDPQGEYARGPVQTSPGTVKDAPEVDKKMLHTPIQTEYARNAEKARRAPAKKPNLSERIM